MPETRRPRRGLTPGRARRPGRPGLPGRPGGAGGDALLLPRIGLGADRHPFDPARALVLGGVRIPGSPGLRGHSDADVLAHAICDALLGALGLEDMGERFRDTDRRWRGRRSLYFVRQVARDVRRCGFVVGNVDAVILAEAPRLRPHLAAMRRGLARALGCAPSRVSVKAKRGEGLGWIGRVEGMAAQAVVLLAPSGRAARATAAKAGRR